MSQQATLRALGDERVRKIVEQYMDAWERGDVDAIARCWLPTQRSQCRRTRAGGRAATSSRHSPREPVHRYLPAHANGQSANAVYRWDPIRGRYVAEALEVLTLEGPLVKAMTAFMMPGLFSSFGLPDELAD